MRIALIGDVHSNQFAFEAVLSQLKYENIDRIIFLGDYSFGGSGSVEVVDMLLNYNLHPYIAIKGNKEEYINLLEKGDNLHPVLYHIYNELGSARIKFLKELPNETVFAIEDIKIKISHNPSKEKMFLVNDRLRRKGTLPNYHTLHKLACNMREDLCVFGHYHMFMDEEVDSKRFICVGSVGMPFDEDGRAKFMIMDILNGVINIEKKYVYYDRSNLIDDFEKKGYFEKYDEWSMNTVISMMTGCNYIGTQDLRRK